jgi:hypothetical protein
MELYDKCNNLYTGKFHVMPNRTIMSENPHNKNSVKLFTTITGIGNPSIIKCSNCNWTWVKKDGGADPYKCHKCNYNNR